MDTAQDLKTFLPHFDSRADVSYAFCRSVWGGTELVESGGAEV